MTVSGHHENLEDRLYEIMAEGYREDSVYDYLVLFSGGKDSTYLAHLLKKARGKRVCLFTVENGFEESGFLPHVFETAELLGHDVYVYRPPKERFVHLYRYLITEPVLRSMDGNPLCFFCGRHFMSLGVRFAEQWKIPFVLYGATPDQVSSGTRPKTARDLRILEMVSARVFEKNYEKIRSTRGYCEDAWVRESMDAVFHRSSTVRLLFPFLFVGYDVEGIKETLKQEYGWKNPSGLSEDRYLTSGCRMVELFGVLARKAGFAPHEKDQFERNYREGTLGESAYRWNRDLFDELLKGEVTPRVRELAEELGVEDMLPD